MPSSGTLRRVVLVRTNISEELSSSIINAEALSSYETSVLTRATRRNIPEEYLTAGIHQNQLGSYTVAVTYTKKLRSP
jgi:hypothetical protein